MANWTAADRECVRVAPGTRGQGSYGRDDCLQGIWSRYNQTKITARGNAAQSRLVQSLHLERSGSGFYKSRPAEEGKSRDRPKGNDSIETMSSGLERCESD